MLDTNKSPVTDRRPFIAIAPWDRGFRAWDQASDLSGDNWHPAGARALTVEADEPDALAARLTQMLRERTCSALLLIGRSHHTGPIRIQTRAVNRRLDSQERLDPTGPGVVRATAPTSEILRHLSQAKLEAITASDAEEDAGSYILYRVLADLPDSLITPTIGLIRLPRDMSRVEAPRAIQTAIEAVASHLPALTTA